MQMQLQQSLAPSSACLTCHPLPSPCLAGWVCAKVHIELQLQRRPRKTAGVFLPPKSQSESPLTRRQGKWNSATGHSLKRSYQVPVFFHFQHIYAIKSLMCFAFKVSFCSLSKSLFFAMKICVSFLNSMLRHERLPLTFLHKTHPWVHSSHWARQARWGSEAPRPSNAERRLPGQLLRWENNDT